jgi:serine phosphatase RsbU (regulator of sigma subunit)
MTFVMPDFPDRRDGGIDWAWRSVPHHGETLSGDALFLEEVRPDGRLVFLLIDVMGHGPEAEFVVDLFRKLYLVDNAVRCRAPAELCLALASLTAPYFAGIGSADSAKGLFTVALAVLIDPSTCEVRLASAGLPEPYRIKAGGEVSVVPVQGWMLGPWDAGEFPEDEPFVEHALQLEPGDALLAATDGLTEAHPNEPNFELFAKTRLPTLLAFLANDGSPTEQLVQIFAAARSYVQKDWPRDDTTAILWRVDPTNS